MKLLKWIGIVIASIALIIVVGGLLLSDKGHVARTGFVDASPRQVHALVNDLSLIKSWSPWLAMDTNAVLTFSGPTSGVGAKYTWVSEKLDNGSYTIASSTPEKVEIDLVFGQMEPALATFTLTPKGNGTEVTWTLDTDAKGNIFSRWFNVMLDMMVGPDFEKGIANMTAPSKKIAMGRIVQMEEYTCEGGFGLGIRSTIKASEIGTTLARNYAAIMQFMAQNNIAMEGFPMAIYHTWDGATTDMEAVIPIKAPAKGNETIHPVLLDKGPMIIAHYYGPYEGSAMAHAACDTWLKEHGKTARSAPFEEYVTDPGTEKDPMKWLTKVYYSY